MKQIVRLGVNRYIHLDSYQGDVQELPFVVTIAGKCLVFVLVAALSAVTTAALLGVDITVPNNNGSTNRVLN
jgi:hypothetical protein